MKSVCELRERSELKPQNTHSFFDEYRLSGFKWQNKNKIWWHVNDTAQIDKVKMSKSEIEMAIRQTERHWEGACNLIFTQTRYLEKADVVVGFHDVPPSIYGQPNWQQQTIALGAYPISSTNRIAGDMWFNTKFYNFADYEKFVKANENFQGNTDFKSVFGHELGHTFGLGHSDTMEAIMAAYYKLIYPFKLHEDDKEGAKELYGMNTNWSQKFRDLMGIH